MFINAGNLFFIFFDVLYIVIGSSVIIRPASDKLLKDKGVIWESLWAALTFGVIRANGL